MSLEIIWNTLWNIIVSWGRETKSKVLNKNFRVGIAKMMLQNISQIFFLNSKRANRFYFIIIFTHYRVDVVARGWRLCTSRDADYAPHQRLTSLLHAWWRHGLRGFGLRTSPGGIRRHCHHFWRLGLRSGLWRFHDVTFKETITDGFLLILCANSIELFPDSVTIAK